MPKKSATARRGAQRQKQKKQKSVALVRPSSQEKDIEPESSSETTISPDIEDSVELEDTQDAKAVSDSEDGIEVQDAQEEKNTNTASVTSKRMRDKKAGSVGATAGTAAKGKAVASEEKATSVASGAVKKGSAVAAEEKDVSVSNTAPKGSAASRLAARRQAQKGQQRPAATLITAEHYSYVRKDLIFIAILALVMFSIIIILHFVPAIGG
jgi:hypothetical protein